MNKVLMKKYGFERCPEEDFSDDGNYFTCYKLPTAPRVRVSKHVSDGQVYLSASMTGSLHYNEYSKLLHYQEATWKYNGVSVASLGDDDLQLFSMAVQDYHDEYVRAEKALPAADEAKIRAALKAECDCYKKVKEEADKLMRATFFDKISQAKGNYMYYAKNALENYKHVCDDYNSRVNQLENKVKNALEHHPYAVDILSRTYSYENACFWLNYLKKDLDNIA